MALRTGNEIESQRDWVKFFNTELKLEQDVANKYAEALFNEGYCGKTIGHLLSHSTGIPSPSLLQLGFKAGHCLKMAMQFNPPTDSDTDCQTPKSKIPRPMLSLNINRVDFDQFLFEWKTYQRHYKIGI